MGRDQYSSARSNRLNYLFEEIELKIRSESNEDIEIKTALSVEHIMPQKWKASWAMPGYDLGYEPDVFDIEYRALETARSRVVNTIGNLTLLTQKLNSSVSNGPYHVKMPALKAHSSLALNRDLQRWHHWDESTISQRGEMLFEVAKKIWVEPLRTESFGQTQVVSRGADAVVNFGLPDEGTSCEFLYSGTKYLGKIEGGKLLVDGIDAEFTTFSGASRGVTKTSRNGWNDWMLTLPDGRQMLADDWRKL